MIGMIWNYIRLINYKKVRSNLRLKATGKNIVLLFQQLHFKRLDCLTFQSLGTNKLTPFSLYE
jgi:hypothetical protein